MSRLRGGGGVMWQVRDSNDGTAVKHSKEPYKKYYKNNGIGTTPQRMRFSYYERLGKMMITSPAYEQTNDECLFLASTSVDSVVLHNM